LDPGYEVSAKQYARWVRIETRSGASFLQRMHGFFMQGLGRFVAIPHARAWVIV